MAPAPVIWFADMPLGFHNPEPRFKIDALRARGHRMLVVDHLGVADPRMRNVRKMASYARRALSRTSPGSAAPAIPEIRLVVLPPRHTVATRALNRALVRRRMRAPIDAMGLTRPILWFRFPSPELVALIGRLGESFVIYECVDRFEAFDYPRRTIAALRTAERELLRRADLTVVTSEGLREMAGRHSRRVVLHRHGVDLGRFAAEHPVPGDLARLPRPLIGYTGPLDRRIDVELVAAVAADHPAGSVVIIGPLTGGDGQARLEGIPNCHLLGARPHGAMPGYVRALDVAMLPYRLDAATRDISPVKSLEYLAAGRAVVATDIAELRRLGAVMAVATSPEDFRDAVRAAVDGAGVGDPESRLAAVADRDWPATVESLLTVVDAHIAGGRGADR